MFFANLEENKILLFFSKYVALLDQKQCNTVKTTKEISAYLCHGLDPLSVVSQAHAQNFEKRLLASPCP